MRSTLPLHALFDHGEVAVPDDLADLVFLRDGGGRWVAVAINCRGETGVTTGDGQAALLVNKSIGALAGTQPVLRLN